MNTKKVFKKVYIEITNVCNLNCDFCVGTKREKRFMTVKEFGVVAAQVKLVSDYAYFHLMGEPLLHPKVNEFLDICEKVGLTVNITTNGTALTDTILDKSALRKVGISVHSLGANDSIDREKAENDIIAFSKKLCDKGKICELRFWTGGADTRFLQKLNDYYGGILPSKLYISNAEKFDWPIACEDEKSGKAFCYGLRDQCGILVDGTVVPCCLDSEGTINLGNVFDTPLLKILSGNRAKAIYNGFTEGKAVEVLCKKCSYRTRFNK